MGRPAGTKNVMRSAEEKAAIVEEYLSGTQSTRGITNKYGTGHALFRRWKKKYEEKGVEGLQSKTGRKKGGNKGQGAKKAKTKEEELNRKIMRLEIEVARLKKGYLVKGVGEKKEYVTTQEKNTK